MTSDPRDWITVASLPGLGSRNIKLLWDAGWTPQELLSADVFEWQRIGLPQKTIDALKQLACSKSSSISKRVDTAVSWCEVTPAAQIIEITSPEYPALLREISDPPPVLFCRGNIQRLNAPQIAIVGSRHASSSGMRSAYQFASDLSQEGLLISSGLAMGIDKAAHSGCVDNDKATIAVFGTGLDKVYPKQNIKLAERILETGGCWVSELFPGTPPYAGNFPKRNRIISGMSAGVLVIEAAVRSGSLITARMALEQNREVFALPGAVNNPMSKGCHKLIREGAVLTETVENILDEISHLIDRSGRQATSIPESDHELSSEELQLLEALGYECLSIDQICIHSGLGINLVSQILVGLELKGVVSQEIGGFIRI